MPGKARARGPVGIAAGRGVEGRILRKDGLLHALQGGAGLYAELIDEAGPGLGVDIERLGLTARPVQREHEQLPPVLAVRLLGDERPRRRDEVVGAAHHELRSEQLLANALDELLEARRFNLRFRHVVELGKRAAAPELERVAEELGRSRRVMVQQRARVLEVALEFDGIGRGVEAIPLRRGADSEPGRAQPQHVRGDRVARRGRRFLPPGSGLQCEPGDGLPGIKRKSGEDAALAAAAGRDEGHAISNLQRTENADQHGAILRGRTGGLRFGSPDWPRQSSGLFRLTLRSTSMKVRPRYLLSGRGRVGGSDDEPHQMSTPIPSARTSRRITPSIALSVRQARRED